MYISLTIFLFRSGIAFYFHLFSTVQVTVRPVGIKKLFFLLSAKPEIVVPESDSGISFSKFPVSRHLLSCLMMRIHSFSTFFALNFDKKPSG
jgi:hypothetical protein